MLFKIYIYIFAFVTNIAINECNIQIGPEPWDYVSDIKSIKTDEDIPPDLKATPHRKGHTNNNVGIGEWFYKRILAIVLKGGQIKKNEDGSVDISIQMNYDQERWNILEDYIKSSTALSEDMYRRSSGYIEEAIYKPTISEKIVLAWSEYIQYYLIEYKIHIMWTSSILTGILTVFWLWNHMSHKHVIILAVISLYFYEVFISYKEAEKHELNRFLKAVNTCKWYIWSSDCEVPPPDPIIFLKHMNPLKIAIRMFTTLLSEPMLTMGQTIEVIIHGVTDGLWFPLDKIMYGVLIVTFNILLVFLLIMIIFNYILNIPFKLNLLGFISVGLMQRNRTLIRDEPTNVQRIDSGDRISGENLAKLLNVYNSALNTSQTRRQLLREPNLSLTYKPKTSRSASTGRLPSYKCNDQIENLNNNVIHKKYKQNGSGDAH